MFKKILTFLKQHWILLIILYAIVSTLLIIIYVNKYVDEKNTSGRLSDNAKINKIPTQTTNRAGDSIAQNKVYRLRLDELEKENSGLYKKLEEYANKGKGVENYTAITTKTKGTISAPVEPVTDKQITFMADKDTIKSLPFKYNDEFIAVTGEAFPTKVDFNYEYRSKTEIIHRWDNVNSLFKDPVLVVEANPMNPKEKVAELVSVRIEPPKKKFYQTTGFKIGVGFVLGSATIMAIKNN